MVNASVKININFILVESIVGNVHRVIFIKVQYVINVIPYVKHVIPIKIGVTLVMKKRILNINLIHQPIIGVHASVKVDIKSQVLKINV